MWLTLLMVLKVRLASSHFHGLGQSGPFGSAAINLVVEDLLAACLDQSFELKVKILIIR